MVLFPVVAYVLIKTSIGKAGDVVQRIRGISGVKEAYTVTGEYDVIAKIEVGELRDLKEVVAGSIHKVEGVEKTVTLIAIE